MKRKKRRDLDQKSLDAIKQTWKESPFYKELIKKFLDSFGKIQEEMCFELKKGSWNEDIKNKTKDAKYWKGYSYGIQAFWGDFVLPEKQEWEKKYNS